MGTGGLFIINEKFLVCQLEAKETSTCHELVRCFRDGDLKVETVHICSFNEEVPRMWPIWASRTINIASEGSQKLKVEEKDIAPLLSQTMNDLLSIGRLLHHKSTDKAKRSLFESDRREVVGKVPSERKIQGYLDIADRYMFTPA